MVSGAEEGILPVVLLDETGRVVDLAWIDGKGYRKSLENGELWAVNRETGRLLPHGGKTPISTIESRSGWYAAVLKGTGADDATGGGTPATAAASAEPVTAEGTGALGDGVLEALAEVIGRRRREQPEGSYTTYLFREGIDKIRKKTGEEAVELILARDRGEIVSEAADLIYHLFVLLEASEIPFREVLAELEKRTR